MSVTILGCGVFGIALANSFLENQAPVCMWSKFQSEVDSLQKQYPAISFSTDLGIATSFSDFIVIAIPVAFLEETMIELKKVYKKQDILIASKGIDIVSGKFAYEIVLEYLKDIPIGVISGGTFAQDMMDKKVMGLTLGTRDNSILEKVKQRLENSYLKIQYLDDIKGVSICGAIKNVMAIGFGILDGALYPESSRFLFLTEAIYEIRDSIVNFGGDAKTIMSYAGLDDIMMTCTSSKSRNYTLGKLIGEGADLKRIEEYTSTTTIEGLGTSKALFLLMKEKKIVSPILSIIYEILYENRDYRDLISYLEEKNSYVS